MISEVRAASRGIYGAPKVFQELGKAGVRTSRKRVARIMRESGWAGTTRGCARRPKGGARQAAPQPCAAPDLVKRDLSADGPDRLWFADITYVRTRQGWPCLAVVMDVRSRMVVGWSMSASMAAELADDALKMAIARRRPGKGCVHHSDSKNAVGRFCGRATKLVSCKPGPHRSTLARTPIEGPNASAA